MQLPEDFWAFSFELNNSLFSTKCNASFTQQRRHCGVVLVLMSLQTVVAVVYNFCSKIHWRVQPTAARRSGRLNKMQGALRALHVSLNNTSTSTVGKCLKKQWLAKNSPNLNRTETPCLRSDARSYFETFIRSPNIFWIKYHTGEDMGQFSAGPINKAVPSFRDSLTRVRER